MTIADRTSQTITLHDGRKLGFAEYGDLDGKPVFLFGGANARYICPDESVAASLGLRLITAERPGFGLSDSKPNRTVLDWADDVRQLAEALRFDRFAIIGGSQGGPFAMACAYKIPDRLTTVTLVSAVAPQDIPELRNSSPAGIRFMLTLAERAPAVLGLIFNLIGAMSKRNPAGVYNQLFKNLPESDKAAMGRGNAMDMFVKDIPQAYRQGGRGGAADMRAVVRPWGFHLEDIRAKVFIWQGEDDPNVSPIMGRYLAKTIPNSEATFVPGAGHFLVYSHWRDILAQLAAYQEATPPRTAASA